jgi:O-6-methylguanine DNA methyltransferase
MQKVKALFTDKVLEVIKSIEKGRVKTYAQVALEAGNPKASRAVGSICRKNTDTRVPCHRVVRSDGSVGEYNGIRNGQVGSMGKVELLKSEGISFDQNNKVIRT